MPETKRPLKVFLCHASADKPKVRELYRYLRRRGIKPWFDEIDLIGGQDWQVEIPKAIATSDAIIICLTKNSVDKEGYIQKEIKFALDKTLEMPEGRIYLIPVRFEECEVPFTLSRYQWVDLFDQFGFTRLMKSLKTRAGQLERAAVQIPKPDDSSPDLTSASEEKAALEEAEREAAKKKQAESVTDEKAAREKVELEAAENAKREEAKRVAAAKLAQEKIEKEYRHQREKILNNAIRKLNREKFLINVRHKLTLVRLYALPMLLGIGVIALLVYVFYYMPLNIPALNSTPTSSLTLTLQPSTTLTETFASTKIVSPSSTPTKMLTVTPASLPTEITDSKGVSMMLVPEGEFTIGTDDRNENEKPAHEVFLDAYYIDKYEVVNLSYRACVGAEKCSLPHQNYSSTHSSYFDNPEFDNYPVIFVDWEQAETYCKWRDAHLPTEAQWEKSARGTDGRNLPWGDYVDTYDNYINQNINGDVVAVGSYELGKSPYGLYDMAGNVWEWVADWYSDTYYQNSAARNPLGPDVGQFRVLRGGHRAKYSWSFSSTARIRFNPAYFDSYIGFRCAKDAP